MIRDPSDGSVRQPQKVDHQSADREPQRQMVSSGLPIDKPKTEEIARIERSREKLKSYRETGKWE